MRWCFLSIWRWWLEAYTILKNIFTWPNAKHISWKNPQSSSFRLAVARSIWTAKYSTPTDQILYRLLAFDKKSIPHDRRYLLLLIILLLLWIVHTDRMHTIHNTEWGWQADIYRKGERERSVGNCWIRAGATSNYCRMNAWVETNQPLFGQDTVHNT